MEWLEVDAEALASPGGYWLLLAGALDPLLLKVRRPAVMC